MRLPAGRFASGRSAVRVDGVLPLGKTIHSLYFLENGRNMAGGGDPAWLDRIEELGVKALIKLVLAVVGLLLFLVFVAVLPGVDRVIPGLPITIAGLISALVTLAIVLLLLRVATRAKATIQRLRITVPDVTARSAVVVYWTVVFFAVVIAYEGFGTATAPILIEADLLWAYDLAFFVLGLAPLLVIGYHLFHLLDPLAELLLSQLQSEPEADRPVDESSITTESATDGDDDEKDPS